ncbi:hypothetical protein Tco_0437946 [Tanacetum coccineum]
MMTGTKFDIEKFDRKNDFTLWHVRMKALLEQQGLAAGVLVGDLAAIDTAISDEDQAFLLLTSLPSSYDNLVETLLYGRDTMKLEDVVATLNSRELQKMTEAKGDGGEGLYVRRRSGQRDMEQGKDSVWSKSQVSVLEMDGHDNADVMMAMSVEELLDWIMDLRSSYYITYRRDYLVDFKEYDSDNILLGDGRECRIRGTSKVQVQMRDGSSFVLDNVSDKKTLKGRKLFRRISDGWNIKDLGYSRMMFGLRETNRTLLAKGTMFSDSVGSVRGSLSAEDTTMSTYLVNKNISFNESGEFKKELSLVGCKYGFNEVLQGDKFEVEPQDGHTFEVEPHENYREDSNEAAFAVAAVEKIYAHESLTFNNTVACEVISKWKAGLKDDMDARSDVYVLSNGCKKCSDDSDGYYWESTPGDCDVEKNGKWSCIYAVGSQEYQMNCTRLASADVDQSQGALSKAIPGLRFQHRSKLLRIGID